MAEERQRGRAHWLVILGTSPCGLHLVVRGWYRCISLISSCVNSSAEEWFVYCLNNHWYLSRDRRVGEAAAPFVRWVPILGILSVFHGVCGNTRVVYGVGFGKESLSGSLSVISIVQSKGVGWRGRRAGETGESVCALCFLIRGDEGGVKCVASVVGCAGAEA